ncbi:transposable element Tc1 transposase [Trichonephila clavipes]|nr:transposable element Tc1 transposase [Trichonephila clavipes]
MGCIMATKSLPRRNISIELKIRKPTVAFVIKQWKFSGDYRNELRLRKFTKPRDKDRRGLSKEIRKNRHKSMAQILQKFQQASWTLVSINVIHKEANLIASHSRAVICNLLILESNHAAQLTWWPLATDHVILNHGQVTWTTPELEPPLLTFTPHHREDVSALDRFTVNRCPARTAVHDMQRSRPREAMSSLDRLTSIKRDRCRPVAISSYCGKLSLSDTDFFPPAEQCTGF